MRRIQIFRGYRRERGMAQAAAMAYLSHPFTPAT
jgi:hypothetical protein